MAHTRLDPVMQAKSTDGDVVDVGLLDTVQVIEVDFSSTNLPASKAYLELDSSLNQDIKAVQVADTGGYTVALAIGAAASESDRVYVGPGNETGGNIPFVASSGDRLSVRAVDTTSAVATGFLVLNLLA